LPELFGLFGRIGKDCFFVALGETVGFGVVYPAPEPAACSVVGNIGGYLLKLPSAARLANDSADKFGRDVRLLDEIGLLHGFSSFVLSVGLTSFIVLKCFPMQA